MEDEGAGTLKIPLEGEGIAAINPKTFPLSQRFVAILQIHMKSKNLRSEWVQDARFTVDLAAFDRLNCSLRVVSDLGRSFEFSRILLVHRHDTRRELGRPNSAAARP